MIAEQTAQIDSLTKASTLLATQLDSASKSVAKYQIMYDTIKEKVIKSDFDPGRTAEPIDSLSTGRSASFTDQNASNTALSDSLTTLKAEYTKLKESTESAAAKEAEKEAAVKDLKELKSLLDQKSLTQQEFDSRKAALLEKL